MSVNDDDNGDGLAALFGGITPQQARPAEPQPREQQREPESREPQHPEPQHPEPQHAEPQPREPQPREPEYPGLSPAAPPSFSAPVVPPPFSASPPSFSAPVPPPFPAPARPSGRRLAAPDPHARPPVSAPPSSTAYDLPAPAPQSPLSYDLPAPAAPPAAPAPPPRDPVRQAASPYPPDPAAPDPAAPDPAAPYAAASNPAAPDATDAPAGPSYPGLAPNSPAYPPTAQYPAAPYPTTQYPTTAYPATEYPVAQSPVPQVPAASQQPPEPLAEPPAFTGFEALGFEPSRPTDVAPRATAVSAPERAPEPVDTPQAEEPQTLVRSIPADPPATIFPDGPLLPTTEVAVETPQALERPTLLEKIGLPIAVIGGPVGLLLAIVTAAMGARRRGWLISITRASLVLGVLSTIVAGFGGVALWELRQQQLQHDAVAAASAEFCAAAAEDPAIVTLPTLGWPAPGATITESITLMEAWTARWTELAASSPEQLRTGMELLAARGQTIIDAVAQARVVDDEANQAQIAGAEGQAGIANWYVRYCLEP